MTQGGHDDWRRPLCRGSADDPVISLHLDPRPAEHPRDPPEEATGHGTASLARHRAGFDVVATCGYIVAVKAVTVRELKNRLKRVSPRGGRRRGRACHGAGPGGGGASTLERRGAPKPRRAGTRASRRRRGADDRPAAGSFVVSADGRANRTFESDPARRRASRPMTLYAGTPLAVRGGRLGTSFIGSSVMRPRSSARG